MMMSVVIFYNKVGFLLVLVCDRKNFRDIESVTAVNHAYGS